MIKRSILLLLAAIISLSVYSQDFESGDLNKRFYLRGGLSTPLWTYYGFKDANDMNALIGADSRIGGNFEIGALFMLNGINIGPNLRFGINVDFLSFKTQIIKLESGENIYNFFVGSKIGPSFSYGLTKAIAFDIFGKVNPVWVGGIYTNLQVIDDTDIYIGYLQPMYSFGVNVRIAVLMLGFEYEIGSMKLKNQDGEFWPYQPDASNSKISMPGYNITVGLNF